MSTSIRATVIPGPHRGETIGLPRTGDSGRGAEGALPTARRGLAISVEA